MSWADIGQIAKSAIEVGLAVANGSSEITAERATKVLRTWEAELGELWQLGMTVADVASFQVGEHTVSLEELKAAYLQLNEAVWSTKFVNDLPDSSFAAIMPGGEKDEGGKTTPRGLRKLPYKDATGKVDLPHLRNALARIGATKGLTAAQKASAQRKLDAAAKKHLKTRQGEAEVDVPTDEEMTEVAGSLRDTARRIEDSFHGTFSPRDRWEGPYRDRDVFMGHPTLGDSIIVDHKEDGITYAVPFVLGEDGVEFSTRDEWKQVELTYQLTQVTEMESDGMAVELARDATEEDTATLSEAETAVIEAGRRAPVVVDFQILKPGPGNKKDNHYYPAEVVERDIHVFQGVDVFATDHKEKERSERTKVGKVLACPTRFTEAKAPVAQVLIYDPAQAEKARNRADANALDTLECSILGNGQAKKGEIDGKEYKIVESITRGRYLELVSKAGAGGKALNLAESEPGGKSVDEEKDKADATPVEEVEIEEAEAAEQKPEPKQEQEPQMLGEEVVKEALDATNLPEFVKAALGERQYESDDELKKAVDAATAEVKKLSGSGAVKDLGESKSVEEELSPEESEQRRKDKFNEIMRDIQLREV
jgi:hypothetical protein